MGVKTSIEWFQKNGNIAIGWSTIQKTSGRKAKGLGYDKVIDENIKMVK